MKTMKKLKVVFSLSMFVMVTSVAGQARPYRITDQQAGFETGVMDVQLKQGANKMQIPTGTVTFFIDGSSVKNVVFLDSLGKVFQMNPTYSGANGAPKPECKSKLPDACFSTVDKNIGMCICRPGDISNGGSVTVRFRAAGRILGIRKATF